MGDEEGLLRLARMLNTTNLPNEGQGIAEILRHSCASFEGKIENPEDRLYLFVLEDKSVGGIVGSSQIIARHGSSSLPHIYFQIETLRQHSESICETREHQILRLGFDTEGYTELGGLVLDPEYRHIPGKLGRWLSLVRLAFISEHRELFMPRLLAELLPPQANENSPLWQAIGKNFTSLSYEQADHLSRKQKEFIEALFPHEPVYINLLPKAAQDVIAQVGEGSKPAQHLLEKFGFKFEGRVDPFDGGPHFEMLTRNLKTPELPAKLEFKNAFGSGAELSLLLG